MWPRPIVFCEAHKTKYTYTTTLFAEINESESGRLDDFPKQRFRETALLCWVLLWRRFH